MTITYNDDTNASGKVEYGPTTRKVNAGATMLGWSYSVDRGQTWKYGGTVAPPPGWAVLWGDPAIASDFSDQRFVYISNLAVPDSKMPAGGITSGMGSALGGACIARSENAGISFKIHQCVHNNFDFYDGASMVAAGRPNDRRVFASYLDINRNQIDVWVSPTNTGVFTRMPNPFPDFSMHSHPRLRFDRTTGTLYVAAMTSGPGPQVMMNRFTNGSWGRPVPVSHPAAGMATIQLSDRIFRTGWQFSFDVGAESENGNDGVRIVYAAIDANTNKHFIRSSFCNFDLTACQDAPEWGTTPGNFSVRGQQFNPSIRAFPGLFTFPPVWKVTYMSTDDDPNGNTVSYKQGNFTLLPNGTRSFIPFNLVKKQVVCSDLRGYWGDYDEVQFAGFDEDAGVARFLFPHSDSTKGCPTRWDFTSDQLHVSAVLFK